MGALCCCFCLCRVVGFSVLCAGKQFYSASHHHQHLPASATLRLCRTAGYRLRIIGHSLGGGTAALLTMMLREAGAGLPAVLPAFLDWLWGCSQVQRSSRHGRAGIICVAAHPSI